MSLQKPFISSSQTVQGLLDTGSELILISLDQNIGNGFTSQSIGSQMGSEALLRSVPLWVSEPTLSLYGVS